MKHASITAIVLLTLGIGVSNAQYMSLQGRLTSTAGEVVPDGSTRLTVRLYDSPAGETVVWTETHTVETVDGLFSMMLGSVTPFDGLDFENPYYVTLSVDGSGELGPPSPFGVVPFAVAAGRLSESALAAGSNVTITKEDDGQLRIDAVGGDTGGLVSVATDNSLSGNGTGGSPLAIANNSVTTQKLGDNAVSTSKLADGAVTGAKLANHAVTPDKLADNSLVAGSNVSVTRRGDGAFEIAATGSSGFELPVTGSTSTSESAMVIGNVGSGTGLHVKTAGDVGVWVEEAGFRASVGNAGVWVSKAAGIGMGVGKANADGLHLSDVGRGIYVWRAASEGLWVSTTGTNGIQIDDAGSNGIQIDDAGSNGIQIGKTTSNGLRINNAGANGVFLSQSSSDGVFVQSAGRDALHVNSASRYGLKVVNANRAIDVTNSGNDAIAIRKSGHNGLLIEDAGNNGIEVGKTKFDGIQIQNAGRDGIRVSNAGGLAGNFGGNVHVGGTLTKNGGSFKIDHPLDPENMYLSHSFVESPDMMNVYNGNVVADANGEATVILPDYFEALNRDFRYQLTAIGAPGPNLYIAEKISDNRFRIAGGEPGMEVSWQVTGIRQDKWANENRIVVEEAKEP